MFDQEVFGPKRQDGETLDSEVVVNIRKLEAKREMSDWHYISLCTWAFGVMLITVRENIRG